MINTLIAPVRDIWLRSWRRGVLSLLLAVLVSATGCGTFMAHRMVQAPNTYPTWFAPAAPVELGFSAGFLTNFPVHFAEVGPPSAKLRYRVIEPGDYHFQVSSTNWNADGRRNYKFHFKATVPGLTNQWSDTPRGTVLLLHGYGLAQFAMAPWAVRLAQEGWRCVLVDLRGHGKSTGRQIYYGLRETNDLSQLLDFLAATNQLARPIAVMGESYGAALALRWKTVEPRVGAVVALAPYAGLSNAVLNISHEYAGWVPTALARSGLKKLPVMLQVPPGELDTTTVLTRSLVTALFIAGAEDKITPASEVEKLRSLAAPGSQWIVVPQATHEALTYFFDDLAQPVADWLAGTNRPPPSAKSR